MRSAAVILSQHRRSRRPAILRCERALLRPDVQRRRVARRDLLAPCGSDARAFSRSAAGKAPAMRRRHRPDFGAARGYLPLVVH